MNTKKIFELSEIYSSTVEDTLKEMKTIMERYQINDAYQYGDIKNALKQSSDNLIEKWRDGRKMMRTEIALRTISNYPSDILKVSLSLDAIINLLDDIFDEVMEKEERTVYIVELVRVLAFLNGQGISEVFQHKISEYFDKILYIAFSEISYKEKIKKTKNFNQRLDYSIQCYNAKSMVMDIFIELPLIKIYGNRKEIEGIVDLARIHRALCIIKKDLIDIDHDIRQNTETPVVILSMEGENILRKYIDSIIKYYKNKENEILKRGFSSDFEEIKRNLSELISEEFDRDYI